MNSDVTRCAGHDCGRRDNCARYVLRFAVGTHDGPNKAPLWVSQMARGYHEDGVCRDFVPCGNSKEAS